MKLHSSIDRTLFAKIRNKTYPVSVAGSGVPCLVIGIGTLMQRTLSRRFKGHFEVCSSDVYWDARYKLEDPSSLTMEQIIDDIRELAESLKISSFVLFAHSAYGIVALEFAKKYPSALKGIIMVGSPVNSNPEVAYHNNCYFESHASMERKKIDSERRTKFAREDLEKLDFSAKFLREYIWRDAARYWHDPSFDCTDLWQGVIVDEVLNHFFTNILPKNNAQKGLDKIKCPIFLAAGMSDYDCCPWMWSEIENPPSKLVVSRFEKSGHYPNYEEEQLFDERIASWIKEI